MKRFLIIVLVALAMPLIARAEQAASSPAGRECIVADLVGTWEMVDYSPVTERLNDNSKYIYFQFRKNGTFLRINSLKPLSKELLAANFRLPLNPPDTYRMVGNGGVAMMYPSMPNAAELAACKVVLQGLSYHNSLGQPATRQRGDILLSYMSQTSLRFHILMRKKSIL